MKRIKRRRTLVTYIDLEILRCLNRNNSLYLSEIAAAINQRVENLYHNFDRLVELKFVTERKLVFRRTTNSKDWCYHRWLKITDLGRCLVDLFEDV